MCGRPPRPPDLSSSAEASVRIAEMNQQLAMEQLSFARQQDAQNQQVIQQVLGIQLPIMEESFRQAMSDRERYEQLFRPFEDALVQEAQRFMDPQFQEAEAARAMQDMAAGQEAQRENALRSLESYGIDPSVARFQAMDRSMRADQAAMQAFAANQGRRDARNEGRALQGAAMDVGRGMSAQGMAGANQALGAGQAAMGTQGMGGQFTMAGFGGAQAGLGQALGGFGQQANIMSQNYQNQMTHHQNRGGFGAALGGLAGMAAGAAMQHENRPWWLGGAAGGEVPGDLAPIPQPGDQFPTMLKEGEYVVPTEVVRAKGTEFFDRLTEKYAPERMEQRALPIGV